MTFNFKKPNRDVHSVFLHCSATDNPDHDNVKFIEHIHVNQNGWSDIGYHFFIDKKGQVFSCRPLERIPAAQRGNNSGTITICLSGLEKENFTENQYSALIELVYYIQSLYKDRLRIRGHNEVANKLCPVYDYKRILNLTDHGFLRERRKKLNQSRTVKGATASGALITGSVVIPEVAQKVNLPDLAQQVTASTTIASGIAQILSVSPYILIGGALAALGYIIYARWDDFKDGIK